MSSLNSEEDNVGDCKVIIIKYLAKMKAKESLLEIVNSIRVNKGLELLSDIKPSDNLRNDIGFTSFDLAELTVNIEDEFDVDIFADGLVNTVGEILEKLNK